MKIWNVIIEPLEERYSEQWSRWYVAGFMANGYESENITGETLTDKIEVGSWLDAYGTNFYKASQVMKIIKMIRSGEIRQDDVLFFHDLWFPGIEAIKYSMEIAGVKIFITGYFHAGTWDPADLLSSKLSGWACHFERSLFELIDLVFITTKFHADLICSSLGEEYRRFIRLIPYGFDFDEIISLGGKAERKYIVFPHRTDPEKQPELFEKLKTKLPQYEYLMTKPIFTTKEKYYKQLRSSHTAISFALQETFGIAMVEAGILGCRLVAPYRLSYPEVIPFADFYHQKEEIDRLIDDNPNWTEEKQIQWLKENYSIKTVTNAIGKISERALK